MKTAGGEPALGVGSVGAPREKAAPRSSSRESAPHRDTKGALGTGPFSSVWLLMAEVSCGDRRQVEIQGVCLQPRLHGDPASVGLTSGEEGTLVNRQ